MKKGTPVFFFNANNVLFFSNITPTIWTIGYAIPRHMQIVFGKGGRPSMYDWPSMPTIQLKACVDLWFLDMIIWQMFG